MCQPGRPGPQPQSHVGSPGLVAFHNTKSRTFSFSYSSASTRAPDCSCVVIQPRELAVGRERRDLEIDRAVGAIGVAVLFELVDHAGHRLQVRLVGGPRRVFDRLDAERARILAKRRDVGVGVFAQRQARLLGADDGLVVDVGEVHDVMHLVAGDVFQRAAQHVHGHEGPEVADVTAGVHGQAAGIHAHRAVAHGRKVLLLPAEGVVETHSLSGDRLRNGLAADGDAQLAAGGGDHDRAVGVVARPSSAAAAAFTLFTNAAPASSVIPA